MLVLIVLALASCMLVLMLEPGGFDPVPAEAFLVPDRKTFLESLDLSRPALAAVKAALDDEDVERAGRAYAAHFRAKELSSPLLTDWSAVPRDAGHDTARSDGYLRGRLDDGYNVYDVPPAGIDWHEAPLACLTRFPIFAPLIAAYHHTGDAKYARFIVDHSLGYIQAWPIERFIGQHSETGWRHHYVVAVPWWWCMLPNRLDEWAAVLPLIRRCPRVDDEELLTILHRMLQETRFLVTQIGRHVAANHNSGCFMMRVLGEMAAVLGDSPDAEHWLAYDAELFAKFLRGAFYPDGLYKELTIGYSASVVFQTHETACAFLHLSAVADERDRLRATVEALAAITKPTGVPASFGDHYAGNIRDYLHEPLLEWLEIPWWRTLLGAGGPQPPFTNWPAAGKPFFGGYYVMRSDWSPDARFLMIDGGPWGTSHQHCDRLSFVLTAFGADFITDPANTLYANNEPDAMLSMLNTGFQHNTVTVDGVDEFIREPAFWETAEPLANLWRHDERCALFEGSFEFDPVLPVRWRRRVLFAGRAYWLLQEVLSGEQPAARIEQNFQFEPDIRIAFDGQTTIATARNGARLLIKPLRSALKPVLTVGDRAPHTTYSTQYCTNDRPRQFALGRGWIARWTNKVIPAPAVTYTGTVKLPEMITLALIPLPPGASLDEAPQILSRIQDESEDWTLPVAAGSLKFRTSVDGCEVLG